MTGPCTPTHPRYIDNGYIQLISVIGKGAYGVVFYALDYRYGQPIKRAVKQLRRHGIDERQRRFQMREISLHRRASRHPSIVHMDRLIEEHDCIYVIMDYGDEGDLFAMITEKQRYAGDNELIRSVFMQILDGVDWLHQIGIAHRDVKPENIVCSDDGTRVRIVDFGLATSESTSSEFGCGSTFYIAPECLGEWSNSVTSYTTRSADVWSLGVILVNLVCGRNPWRCASPSDESFAAFLQDPTFLRRILPISEECLSILTQIFTLDPEQRMTLDHLRNLILSIESFTEEEVYVHVAPHPNRRVVPPIHIPTHTVVDAPDICSDYSADYHDVPDAESVFTFDEDLDIHDSELPPGLREDSGSPIPTRCNSSSSASDDIYPNTPKLENHTHHTTPRVVSDSSFTSPVFEAFGARSKGSPLSPVPYTTPAMFL